MIRVRSAATVISAALLASCQTMDNQAERSALLVDRTAAVQAELQAAVNAAAGAEVLLADDAFASNSVISIERRLPPSMNRPQQIGRDYSAPIKFRLLKRGARCYLLDTRTDRRYLLDSASCVPE